MNAVRNKERYRLLPLLAVFILLSALIILKPGIIGYATVTKEFNYTDNLNLVANETTEMLWFVEHPGNITSIRLSGSLSADGSAKVYIENYDELVLVFDSSQLEKEGLDLITGLVVDSSVSGGVVETNIGLVESNNDLEENNNTELNNQLIIQLGYNNDSSYDVDNDGVESLDGVIDLTVGNSEIGLNNNKLCTKWGVENLDNNSITTICHGNEDCCGFIDLASTRDDWDSPLYLGYGKYGAGLENVVSAQVINADYNLSVENAYSYVSYSDISNLTAVFMAESLEFKDVCVESCSLAGFNGSVYKLIIEVYDGTLTLSHIKYTTIEEIPNSKPVFNPMPSLEIDKNSNMTINLSNYAYDGDNDNLVFGAYESENLSVLIEENIATIIPDKDFVGVNYIYFTANDSIALAYSNNVEVRVVEMVSYNKTETIKQGFAVIGQPVRWVKTVKLNATVSNVSVNITSDAANITVKKIEKGYLERKVEVEKIKVKERDEVKELEEYETEKLVENIEEEIDKLAKQKTQESLETVKELNKKIKDLNNEKNQITGYVVGAESVGRKGVLTRFFEWLFSADIDDSFFMTRPNEERSHKSQSDLMSPEPIPPSEAPFAVTGYVVLDSNNEESNTTLIIEEEAEELEIEYYTEPPTAEEEDTTNGKKIVVSSEVHYENILAYTYLDDVPREGINLYWIVNDSKQPIDFEAFDTDSDDLIEYIQWIVPHLSNQTYEVSITVLNVQSYPMVGGNWTVRFNTTGSGNLTIMAVNSTTFTEVYDDSATLDDLEFLEVKCGDAVVNASVVLVDESVVPYDVYVKVKRVKEIDEELR